MLHLLMLFMLADPFLGTWKLRADKAGAASGFESYVVTVTATDRGQKWSYDFVVKGMSQHMKPVILVDRKTSTFKYFTEDGQVVGQGKIIMKAPTEWEVDAPNLKSRTSLSPDGKTMTVVNGGPKPITLVLDKQ